MAKKFQRKRKSRIISESRKAFKKRQRFKKYTLHYTDGPDSGQEFYEKILQHAFKEALRDNAKFTIDLDGTEGYAHLF